jgi:hypothetical protein
LIDFVCQRDPNLQGAIFDLTTSSGARPILNCRADRGFDFCVLTKGHVTLQVQSYHVQETVTALGNLVTAADSAPGLAA